MPGSIFISRLTVPFALLLGVLALAAPAFAADESRPNVPEEDDFGSTPYTQYGEFNNQEAEEEADTRFFQYGRFFGISVGLGAEQVLGNRGGLWNGGFPMIELKLHYWFDFNFALMLDVFSAPHFYEDTDAGIGHVDVTMVQLGLSIKYYFETKNLSSTISFANPYIIAGVGSYTKTETSSVVNTPDSDSSIGLSAGAGLEFAISPKKTYFELEGRLHVVNFKDTFTTRFQSTDSTNLDDLTGQFVTLTAQFLFTW